MHLALKGVRSYWWAEGSTEIMKIIVGRELLGKEFVANKKQLKESSELVKNLSKEEYERVKELVA